MQNAIEFIKHINFCQATTKDYELIRSWLELPEVKKYWQDNGVTLNDLKLSYTGSSIFTHWLGYHQNKPFCYFMTSNLSADENDYSPYIDKKDITLSLDFLIADEEIRGTGIAHLIIKKFLFENCQNAKAVLIDPKMSNTRAIRVYQKAGFKIIADFYPSGGPFKGMHHILMKHDLSPSLFVEVI